MDKINFTVNGESYTLSGSEVSPTTTLNEYLRSYLQLHGTKSMCHEGGCGACVVSVSQTHPSTKEKHTFSVNSCLVHILSCHQWDITTVEGIGNQKDGYHPIQSRLAAFNGTQCGYCSPGWVMSMYSLYEGSNMKLTTEQVENSFGGNLCRCTGYRPILDAFKSFAVDADPELQYKLCDLEDLHAMKCVKNCERRCSVVDDEWCVIHNKKNNLLELGGTTSRWYKAFTVADVFKVLAREGFNDYQLVAGNTSQGVFLNEAEPRIFVDISSIESLKGSVIDANLTVGAGTSLTDLMELFRGRSTDDDFKYLDHFLKHLDLVAHVPVRNIGTIGGNLAMKHTHREFPSDIFLLLEIIQAVVTVVNQNLVESYLSMQDFLKADLKGKLITNIKFPPLSSRNLIRSYKIMPRAQNALAILNAGFHFKVDAHNNIETAHVMFSPIADTFVRASLTEQALVGLPLFSDVTLSVALKSLSEEIRPMDNVPTATPACRKALALGLFYKAMLSLSPEGLLNPRYASGASVLSRGISRGTQTFDTDKSLWPLNQPVPKLEALVQSSGEANYACDVNSSAREVQLAFVLSTIRIGEIEGFDASEALKLPGVVAFFTAKDIPGKNCFTPLVVPWQVSEEEILASKKVSYYGQPLGIVAAVTRTLALKASGLVKVNYKTSEASPVLSIGEALVAPDKERRVRADVTVLPSAKGDDVKHVIQGSFSVPSQLHFTMEPHSCYATNTAVGIHVRSSTQWIDLVHVAIAQMLDIDQNKVEVTVDRVGGGYGGKASRSGLVACSAALVARKLRRPVAFVLPPQAAVAVGARQQCVTNYQLGVNDEGVVQNLSLTYYSDCGYNFNDASAAVVAYYLGNLYDSSRWTIKGYSVLTDKAGNTWCRAPGTTEATATIEHIMEHIAHVIKKDPIEVRIANLAQKHASIKDLIYTLKYDSHYEERKAQIATYNSQNAWKKKGLKLTIMSFPIEYSWNFAVTISVYHGDGTVAISHGGIEMGQGINTKIAQVCAYTLKIPLEKVTVFSSNSFVSPNAMASNGSITSDSVAYATVKACNELLERFEPIKEKMNLNGWEDVVTAAYEKGINLQTTYMAGPLDSLKGYDVYGACVAEVELDVLTGRHMLTRVDLLEDVGVSLSPQLDVGQIEGAFVMGLGLWTSEALYYAPSGQLLTRSTWEYHPAGAKDVPVDMRVSFRKNSPNEAGVLRSKATGEPALTMSVVVAFALHEAIMAARGEFGYDNTQWLPLDAPYCVENILKSISLKTEYFKLK